MPPLTFYKKVIKSLYNKNHKFMDIIYKNSLKSSDLELKREQVKDKYTRFLEISTDIENGYVYIPEHADWVLEFLAECESFDAWGTYKDDRIDCLIYALKVRRQRQDIDWDKSLNEFNYY